METQWSWAASTQGREEDFKKVELKDLRNLLFGSFNRLVTNQQNLELKPRNYFYKTT